jgi:hypothetical protein
MHIPGLDIIRLAEKYPGMIREWMGARHQVEDIKRTTLHGTWFRPASHHPLNVPTNVYKTELCHC